jgi:hypothetical protein
MKTDVIFLLEKDEHQTGPKGSVFAYFPNEPDFDCYGNKPSYAHIGQHSACSINYAEECKLATPDQYRALKAELESIGYDLNIINL